MNKLTTTEELPQSLVNEMAYIREADVIAELLMEIYEDLFKSKAGNKAAARRARKNMVVLANKGIPFRKLSMKVFQRGSVK